MSKIIMWFRKDLRLDDNTAFNKMIENSKDADELICLFQLNPLQFIEDSYNHDAFFSSLYAFYTHAEANNVPIHFVYGSLEENFTELKKVYQDWNKVYFNVDERGFGRERDQKMTVFFERNHIQVHSYQDSHLHGVKEIKKPTGESYKVFTPYFRKWLTMPKRPYERTQTSGQSFAKLTHPLFIEGEKQFNQIIEKIKLPFDYECGEVVAEKYLKEFIRDHLHDYQKVRDFPFSDQTSKLSRFLRTGELSIRKVWYALNAEPDSDGRQTFISELCWRDFYNMIYYENPNQKTQEIKEQYRQLHWSYNQEAFERWKNGQTGFPIVDAGMRQLNQTGWMHNRLRMIVASFLTKDLMIDWQLGEKYFQQKLIDYDAASNIGGWQWAASTGTDAVPYFRIFNPTSQAEKFDSQGDFIRLFIPELKDVPNKYIHEPSKMPADLQQSIDVLIGKEYPKPMVDHSKIRSEILAFFKTASS
ncbi:cryptochrome/photolyase family protein [Candidatus Enterococcus ikei]|uniref:Deoxyribodipyrimidine photo-lyase n=1 Tax=Candidatus Enterococcus ikei TaxID=2815326 RepID=A0ABS3GZ01_9ENTE|nr:deoxyribodipyrimidine photo-lyase [Enterococcus sp. DIV0869a]MBO0440490.1 deoxyribodipyrimidine photo-lyase [Enterococcus sp. DIV0869a]